jgi:Na+-driven multidrug efflux pump
VASTIATLLSLAGLVVLLPRAQRLVRLDASVLTPKFAVWIRLAKIGVPAAGEMFMMFVILGVLYRVIRVFGPDAQAGFAIGGRVMQAIFLPAMAVAFAAAPVAGQNFGAREYARVRATFRHAALIGAAIMLTLTALCQIRPDQLVAPFTHDANVVAQAVSYLRIISWNFVGSGLVFACSGVFQGLGDTTPSLISSASRLLTFVLPAFWLAGLPGARLEWIWHMSVASVALQAVTSLLLLRGVFRRRLGAAAIGTVVANA